MGLQPGSGIIATSHVIQLAVLPITRFPRRGLNNERGA